MGSMSHMSHDEVENMKGIAASAKGDIQLLHSEIHGIAQATCAQCEHLSERSLAATLEALPQLLTSATSSVEADRVEEVVRDWRQRQRSQKRAVAHAAVASAERRCEQALKTFLR